MMAENTTPEENQTETREEPLFYARHTYAGVSSNFNVHRSICTDARSFSSRIPTQPLFNVHRSICTDARSFSSRIPTQPLLNVQWFDYERPQNLLESRSFLQKLSEKPLSSVGQSEHWITPIFREHQVRYKQPQSLLDSLHVCQRLAEEVKNIRQPQWSFRQSECRITPTFQEPQVHHKLPQSPLDSSLVVQKLSEEPQWSVGQSGLWISLNSRKHQAHRASELSLLDPREPRKSMMASILPLQEYAPWTQMNAGTNFSLISVCA